jgi:hypothetical protein
MPPAHPRPLHTLDHDALAAAAADQRWPKWSTMCQLHRLGNPVLNAVCVTPETNPVGLRTAITALADATGAKKLMVRSDGGQETRAYYRGGNSFPIAQIEPHATELLKAGRAVILLEPTNRFTNQLSALLRLDRPIPGQPGSFIVEALGAGYDVGDLTRGGIRPQVTVTIDAIAWHRYEEPWWADQHVTRELGHDAEQARQRARLQRLAPHIHAVTTTGPAERPDARTDPAAAAVWLHDQGYLDLWAGGDPTGRVVQSVPRWFDTAFLIAATHPNRDWRCLATSLSDLGAGRLVYWDIVDAAHKYAPAPGHWSIP